MIQKIFFLALVTRFVLAIDLAAFENDLKGSGVEGEVHGGSESAGLYVFVYRNPADFFDYATFPLISYDNLVLEQFKTLGRHDRVKIKGQFRPGAAPIKHIAVNELSVVTKYESGVTAPPHQYEAKLPDDLVGKDHFSGKVHAILEGKILVAEYKDAVIPVFTDQPDLLKNLYRNDKVDIYFKIRRFPNRPVHVELDKDAKTPIKVTDSMVAWHGKSGSLEGNLVLFPKSPQVKFNVFALHNVDSNGVDRQFTLVNFDDEKVFEKIRIKLQDWWDQHPGDIKNIRNKYLNLKVRIKATGTFNVVDPQQANPQILLSGPDSIELIS